jgi:hypothetical protein
LIHPSRESANKASRRSISPHNLKRAIGMGWKIFKRGAPSGATPPPTLRDRLPDATPQELETIRSVRMYTMTSPERILALIRAVRHLVEQEVPGDFVECGVWRGGSVLAMLRTLQELGAADRTVWLYDTFEGMSPPTASDVDFQGNRADQLLARQTREDPQSIWCFSGLDEVRRTLGRSGYPEDLVRLVPGPVEVTLQSPDVPQSVALLRLDTDWYESTMMELQVLFPRLNDRGVLLIDDYGHWRGCRRAVDEYFSEHGVDMFLHRIDYTGRIGIQRRMRAA